ncbi:MAG: DUF2628 domain-containing protein [Hyphomicrobium sp.]
MARVSAFTVHEPPQGGGTRLEQAERLLFVGDGFSWRAALFSPFYLLVRGEWVALLIYVAAAALLSGALALAGASEDWYVWTFILLNIVMGFEASEIKRWSLDRSGWREVAAVVGRGQEEAERLFFDAWLPTTVDAPQGQSLQSFMSAGALPARTTAPRVESAVKRLSERLRSQFALKS